MKKYKKHLAWLFFIVGGFAVGLFSEKIISELSPRLDSEPKETYSLISPEVVGEGGVKKYIPFEINTIKKIFEEVELPNPEISLSVYVRNLDNGPWFGIHESEVFAPIELLKMPLFIAYLKWSEENPDILKKKLSVGPNKSSPDLFLAQKTLDEKKEYTVEKLLEEMMINSSEQATDALRKEIDQSYLIKVDTDLGIIVPGERGLKDSISLKEYSAFYRILYGAAYLSPKSSDFALRLLTKTDFQEGITSGIPSGVEVANKFGERIYTGTDGSLVHQIHDCGIVYYEEYPYILCIAIQGDQVAKLPHIIGDVAEIVHTEISRAYN